MDQQSTFGDWLKSKRKALGLTQAGLADAVGCSAAAVRKIEAEERRPSVHIVERLAEIFKILPNERAKFLRFARGDWQSVPTPISEDAPWRVSGVQPRSNLSAPLTSLIGRGREISAVREYLADDGVRLVTLLGPPGIGKTRLSLEVAHDSIQTFLDGVFFVSLAPLHDPDLLAQTIVQTLGFVEMKSPSALERLKDGIGDKQMLLVLDNLEHLIENAALLVSELLPACPHLKILTTSREALQVSGEWLYLVPALKSPTTAQLKAIQLEAVSSFSALNLFSVRARAVRPEFSINSENLKTVAAICDRLDGLPLAIELFAARIRYLSPQAMLARLSEPLILQAEGLRALPARQKTLYDAISWSFSLLPADEQRLFALLSVFIGGFTQDAVEKTFAQSSLSRPTSDLMFSLLNKSLLQRSLDDQDEPRFYLLVTIQQFALEQLREMGEESSARERHLAYFCDLAGQADRKIHGPDQVEWINRLELEQENYRAALEWCLATQNIRAGLSLLGLLSWPWWLRGYSNEVQIWFEKISSLPGLSEHPLIHARLLSFLGQLSYVMGDFAQARQMLEKSQAIGQVLGVDGEICLADTYISLGMLELADKEAVPLVQSLFEKGLALYQKQGDQRGKAYVMMLMGRLANILNQGAPAIAWFEQSLALFQQLGDIWGMGRTTASLGQLFLKQENYAGALLMLGQHLQIDEQLRFWPGTAVALCDLGNLYRQQGDFEQADQYFQKSLIISQEHGMKLDLSNCWFYLGLLALQRNDYQRARQYFIDYFLLARNFFKIETSACDLLIGLAAAAGGMHQPERAAKLNGAFHPLLDQLLFQYKPFDRAVFDRHIHMAQVELGEAAFEALAVEGSAMTLEQAVSYALEDTIDL